MRYQNVRGLEATMKTTTPEKSIDIAMEAKITAGTSRTTLFTREHF